MIYILTEQGILYTSILGAFDDLDNAKVACEQFVEDHHPNYNPMYWDKLNYRDSYGGGYFIIPLELNQLQEYPGLKYRESK